MKILLLTNEKSTNFGDDFLSEVLKKTALDISNELSTGDFVFYRKYKNKVIGLFLGLLELIGACRKNDKIIVAGGNLLLPQSKQFVFCFSILNALKYLLKFELEVRYVGASGFTNNTVSKLMKFNIKNIDYISVRDKSSKRILSEKLNTNSTLICDAAFLYLPAVKTNLKMDTSLIFIPIDYSCLSYKKKKEVDRLSYYKINLDFLQEAKNQGYNVRLMTTDSVDNDFAYALAKGSCLELKLCQDLKKFKEELQEFNGIVVATRMHAIILSILMANKTIGVNWSDKVEDLVLGFDGGIPLIEFNDLARINISEKISCSFSEEKINEIVTGNRKLISTDLESAIRN